MRRSARATALVLGVCFLLPIVHAEKTKAAKAAPERLFKVGVTTRSFVPEGTYNWRNSKEHKLITTIWYPAESSANEQAQWIPPGHPLFSAGKAAPEAPLAQGSSRYPLIVLSHGTGGSSFMMAWLGTVLASRGYIAAAVNHPGNNAVTGYELEGFLLWWLRARDLSVVVDRMLADPTFASRTDSRRIGAAGFSLGGYTMIEVAGGITQPEHYREFCKAHSAENVCQDPPEFPGLHAKAEELLKNDADFRAAWERAGQSYRDPRVKAVFAIAPALGPVVTSASLAGISIPVVIVAGDADNIVPVASSAKFFASHIPRAKLRLLPNVGHYTFLGTCTGDGRKAEAAICTDQAGVDREAVHAKVAGMAVEFFRRNLR